MAKNKRVPTIPEVLRRRRADVLIARGYRSLLWRCVLLALVVLVLFTQVFAFVQVSGNEMFPAVKDGDLLFVYRLQTDIAKNDVVVYTHDGKTCVGRVLGRPGDVITIDEAGTLLVNGTTQSGEILYPTYPGEDQSYPYVVPEGSYYLLGDYRTQAQDSRVYGAIPAARIEGKVITILRRRGI